MVTRTGIWSLTWVTLIIPASPHHHTSCLYIHFNIMSYIPILTHFTQKMKITRFSETPATTCLQSYSTSQPKRHNYVVNIFGPWAIRERRTQYLFSFSGYHVVWLYGTSIITFCNANYFRNWFTIGCPWHWTHTSVSGKMFMFLNT